MALPKYQNNQTEMLGKSQQRNSGREQIKLVDGSFCLAVINPVVFIVMAQTRNHLLQLCVILCSCVVC